MEYLLVKTIFQTHRQKSGHNNAKEKKIVENSEFLVKNRRQLLSSTTYVK